MKKVITKYLGFKKKNQVNGSAVQQQDIPAGKLPDYIEIPLFKWQNSMKKDPRRTALWMFVLVLLNFVIFEAIFFVTNKGKSLEEAGVINIYDSVKAGVISVEDIKQEASLTWSNYFKVKAIKDSMDILMKKRDSLTGEDKKQFINLMQQFKSLENENK